jgi:hypothetical protein
MKDVVAVVIKEGYCIVTQPCGMVFPGEICSGGQIFKFIVLPTELPQDVACFALMHITACIYGRR